MSTPAAPKPVLDYAPKPAKEDTRASRFKRAALSGAVFRAINIATQLLSVGVTTRYLGSERYGMWAIVSTFIAWFAVGNVGLGHGLTAMISKAYGKRDVDSAHRYFNSALAIVSLTTLALGVITLIASFFIPWHRIFNVATALAIAEARPVVIVSIIMVLISLPAQLSASLLIGYQRMDISNIVNAAASFVGLGLLFAAVKLHVGLPTLATVLLLPVPLGLILQAICARRLGLLRLSPSYVSWREGKNLLNLGVQFLIMQVFGIAVFEIGAFIIARKFGAAEVTPYAVTNRMVMVVLTVCTIVMAPLWPAYGEAFARGELQWVKRVYFKSLKVVLAIWTAFAIGLLIGGRWVIHLWAGAEAVPSFLLLASMIVFTLAQLMGIIVAYPLNGMGKLSSQIIGVGLMAIVHLPLALFLCKRFGPAGVAISQSLVMLLISVPLAMWHFFKLVNDANPSAPPEGIPFKTGIDL